TKVESVQNLEKCPATKVNGPFEYFTFQTATAMAVMVELQGKRDFAPGSLPSVKNENDEHAKCGEIWVDMPASSEPVKAGLQLAPGMMLAMPSAPGFEMEITKDHKSFIQRATSNNTT